MNHEVSGVGGSQTSTHVKHKMTRHILAHAKIGSSECDATETQRDAEVPRHQRQMDRVPILAFDDLAPVIAHVLFVSGFAEDYVVYSHWL